MTPQLSHETKLCIGVQHVPDDPLHFGLGNMQFPEFH